MYKLIIAGGRDFNQEALMISAIQELMDKDTFTEDNLEIVSGTARGADNLGAQLARANNIPVKEFPADWKDMSLPVVRKHNQYGEYNALAGMKRNHKMGDYADGLLAFWDGKSKGTKDMIAYMHTLNKPIAVIHY